MASAQEQENKLVNRILKPNVSLANPAQNKMFRTGSASLEKQAPVKTFYLPEKSLARPFYGEREFASKQFAAQHFRTGDSAAYLVPHLAATKEHSSTGEIFRFAGRSIPTGSDIASTSSFSGSRPFLGRGKSQKALSAHDTPLTIEQVRELLNKNR